MRRARHSAARRMPGDAILPPTRVPTGLARTGPAAGPLATTVPAAQPATTGPATTPRPPAHQKEQPPKTPRLKNPAPQKRQRTSGPPPIRPERTRQRARDRRRQSPLRVRAHPRAQETWAQRARPAHGQEELVAEEAGDPISGSSTISLCSVTSTMVSASIISVTTGAASPTWG